MKILMASADHDNKALAVVAFKNLNAANSIDFVTTVDELMSYIKMRTDSGHELPDLLLFGLRVSDRDILNEIQLDSRLANLKVVTFSIHSRPDNENTIIEDSNYPIEKKTSSEELTWILNEICDGLVAKNGWQYSANQSLRTANM